jgi:hypothetical protein
VDISDSDALELAKSFPRSHLLIGSGAGLQYHNPGQAIDDTLSHLASDEPALLIFGGDTADAENPDLGYLVQEVKARSGFACKVLSVQSWPEVDAFVDYVLTCERDFSEDGEIEYWGGLVDGKPVAATRSYLSREMQIVLSSVICIGGGNIAKQELSYSIQCGVKHHYIRAEVRKKREGSNPYGPTDDWYQNHANHTNQ